jgi:hypothetical protein
MFGNLWRIITPKLAKKSVFWIRIRIYFGRLDPVTGPHWKCGFKNAKIYHKKGKRFEISYFDLLSFER